MSEKQQLDSAFVKTFKEIADMDDDAAIEYAKTIENKIANASVEEYKKKLEYASVTKRMNKSLITTIAIAIATLLLLGLGVQSCASGYADLDKKAVAFGYQEANVSTAWKAVEGKPVQCRNFSLTESHEVHFDDRSVIHGQFKITQSTVTDKTIPVALTFYSHGLDILGTTKIDVPNLPGQVVGLKSTFQPTYNTIYFVGAE